MAYPNTFAETALPWPGGKDVVENWLPVLGFEAVAKVNGALLNGVSDHSSMHRRMKAVRSLGRTPLASAICRHLICSM